MTAGHSKSSVVNYGIYLEMNFLILLKHGSVSLLSIGSNRKSNLIGPNEKLINWYLHKVQRENNPKLTGFETDHILA